MIASPAMIMRSLLIDAGLVLMPFVQQEPGDGTTVCFVDSMPDESDQAVLIVDTTGIMTGKLMAGKELLHPGVRITVRALSYTYGYDLTNRICATLTPLAKVTTVLPDDGTTHYVQSITRTTSIISLGEEKSRKRQGWSINFRMSFQDSEPVLG